MKNKARKQFILYAVVAVSVLLTVLLTVINVINFTMAASDADTVTSMLASENKKSELGNGSFDPSSGTGQSQTPDGRRHGGSRPQKDGSNMENPPEEPPQDPAFGEGQEMPLPDMQQGELPPENLPQGQLPEEQAGIPFSPEDGQAPADGFDANAAQSGFGRTGMDRMGPSSPEMLASVRYFTVKIGDGSSELVALHMNAYTEEDALALAEKLASSGSKTGWTDGIYRYRVYKSSGEKYVTVIDQGRELTPSYRILWISVIGGLLCILASFLFLFVMSKKIFRPLEEADRKQKQFIAGTEKEMKVPLTVIAADVECIERKNGPGDATVSIRRQTKKMTKLVERVGDLAIFGDGKESAGEADVRQVLSAVLESFSPAFEESGLRVDTDLAETGKTDAGPRVLERVFREVCDNVLKFALTNVSFRLTKEEDRLTLTVENDASLEEEGSVDQVFDRFRVLSNASSDPGAGLGLRFVKEASDENGWRVSASVVQGRFVLKILF